MQALVQFMNSPTGRLMRIALGLAIVLTAFEAMDGTAAWIIVAIGFVPVALGMSGRCLFELLPGASGSR